MNMKDMIRSNENSSPNASQKRPKFDDLPLGANDPQASAWGLWGISDELGALNLLSRDVVKAAAQEISLGRSVSLNLPLDWFPQPMNPVRKPCEHRFIPKGHANDDEIHINTQGSSHWDGLRHYPYQETLEYYQRAKESDFYRSEMTTRLGIHNVAKKGIAGRGVLLDWARYAKFRKIQCDPFSRHSITLAELHEVALQQKVQFRSGDILIVRTGWLEAYNKLSIEERKELPLRDMRSSCGLEASEEMIRWHWDNEFAAVASDTVAYEAWPSPRPWGVSLHEVFLSGWGMLIGESFDLEELSQVCREIGRWTFFLTSQPLHIPGGVASPANVQAIL